MVKPNCSLVLVIYSKYKVIIIIHISKDGMERPRWALIHKFKVNYVILFFKFWLPKYGFRFIFAFNLMISKEFNNYCIHLCKSLNYICTKTILLYDLLFSCLIGNSKSEQYCLVLSIFIGCSWCRCNSSEVAFIILDSSTSIINNFFLTLFKNNSKRLLYFLETNSSRCHSQTSMTTREIL